MSPAGPDVLLLTTPDCPHCPGMKQQFTDLLAQGDIGKFESVDITRHPGIARDLQVKSVPWFRIGPFELQGLHTLTELRQWIAWAQEKDGIARYIDELLSSGQLNTLEQWVRRHPEHLHAIITLIIDPDTGVSTRVGIGALLEGLTGSGLAKPLATELAGLLTIDDVRIRTDVIHYLGLTENPATIPVLEKYRDDADANVREVVVETLEILGKK